MSPRQERTPASRGAARGLPPGEMSPDPLRHWCVPKRGRREKKGESDLCFPSRLLCTRPRQQCPTLTPVVDCIAITGISSTSVCRLRSWDATIEGRSRVPQTTAVIHSNYNNWEEVISAGIVLRLIINAFALVYLHTRALQKLKAIIRSLEFARRDEERGWGGKTPAFLRALPDCRVS